MADLSVRYATALFELALERGLVKDYLEQAAFVSATMQDADAKRIIIHPRIPESEKFAFLDTVFKGRIHDDLLGFMRLTVTKNREEYLTPALDTLVDMIRRHQNHTTAKVVSAVALSAEQERQLLMILTRKLGKTVDLSVEVDASAIGGFRLHVDGFVFDHTLRYLLKGMKVAITASA